MNLEKIFNLSNQFYKLALIQHPPINKLEFVRSLKKKIVSSINEILSNISYFKDKDEYYLQDSLHISYQELSWQSGRLNRIIEENLWPFKYIEQIIIENSSYIDVLNSMLRNLNESLDFLLKFKKFIDEKTKNTEEHLEYFLKYNKDEDYPGIKIDDYKKILILPKLCDNAISIAQYGISKLQIWFDTSKSFGKAPKSEKIELLYHTSVNANNLSVDGFKEDWDQGTGLGGSSSISIGKGVSFTSNLYVAKEIARCLKEVIAISHGKIKIRDILRWADEAGVLEKVKQEGPRIYGPFEEGNVESVYNAYRTYLAYANFDKKRYNPLFIGYDLLQKLSGKSEQDVGIVVAEIDMTNSNIEYLQSMDEYRVPVKAINKIVKIIR